MFTGIVREVGEIETLESRDDLVRLRVRAPETSARSTVGDSVSVNGVCLTATAVVDGSISFDAVAETLRRSALGRLAPGRRVNVEPALRAGEPLGGHLVQGHVDGVGRARGVRRDGDDVRIEIEAPQEILRFCVEKGSVSVDGVSLTIAALEPDAFSVALVPHTLRATTLGSLGPGDEVNLEADVVAKYVERALATRPSR